MHFPLRVCPQMPLKRRKTERNLSWNFTRLKLCDLWSLSRSTQRTKLPRDVSEQQRKQGAAGDREQADPAQSTSGGLADDWWNYGNGGCPKVSTVGESKYVNMQRLWWL